MEAASMLGRNHLPMIALTTWRLKSSSTLVRVRRRWWLYWMSKRGYPGRLLSLGKCHIYQRYTKRVTSSQTIILQEGALVVPLDWTTATQHLVAHLVVATWLQTSLIKFRIDIPWTLSVVHRCSLWMHHNSMRKRKRKIRTSIVIARIENASISDQPASYIKLHSFIINKYKLKHLSCYKNKIKKLNLPDTLEELYCATNEIVRLKLPNSLKIVNCSRNKIKTIKIPQGIEELYCSYNKITSLKLPSGLKKLSCSENFI